MGDAYLSGLIKKQFAALGYPPDEHTKDSPERIARYMREWHTINKPPPKITKFKAQGHSQMVTIGNIPMFSLCAHHGLPFNGMAAVGYIPSKHLAGLSKFARVIDHFSHRYTVQEVITGEVADYLWKQLKPKGLGVVLCCEHQCMSMRGVHKPGHWTTTTDLRGVILTEPETRAEFMAMTTQRGR